MTLIVTRTGERQANGWGVDFRGDCYEAQCSSAGAVASDALTVVFRDERDAEAFFRDQPSDLVLPYGKYPPGPRPVYWCDGPQGHVIHG